jgi:hypothetical protein
VTYFQLQTHRSFTCNGPLLYHFLFALLPALLCAGIQPSSFQVSLSQTHSHLLHATLFPHRIYCPPHGHSPSMFFFSTRPFSVNLISLYATTNTTYAPHTSPSTLSPSTFPLHLSSLSITSSRHISQKTTAPQNDDSSEEKRVSICSPPFYIQSNLCHLTDR